MAKIVTLNHRGKNTRGEFTYSYKKVSAVKGNTACPREVVARGGHPLWLIYDRKRVPGFLSFEPFEFGIFWNLYQPNRMPIPHFSSTYRILGGCPSLTQE